ncbi:hypothetical protein [Thalassobius sp. Cn5-15]|uniref:hypothetical protein n=1 Tax=Thalassobius sp. Cn5-15 TaxID=2917763 RepID=UPI001EF39349|nr:hypothetical protein [Thalassobius sp. Cn5-15]MCG7492433.1 hypothetical protein [Thalassobius sp. Cn5-15]
MKIIRSFSIYVAKGLGVVAAMMMALALLGVLIFFPAILSEIFNNKAFDWLFAIHVVLILAWTGKEFSQ